MAAFAAGGEVKANPKGREMGVARKIRLTAEGLGHPFYAGKPPVFDGFISHLDEVTSLPPGGTLLATGGFTRVMSIEVRHKKGVFWGIQYHVEYDLKEMASLIVAREKKLVQEGFFRDHEDLAAHVGRMKALAAAPSRRDLGFQLGIDGDLLDPGVRECEFGNWIKRLVIPEFSRRRG
jgi:GMP synthase (glutamine-hydrolysing)